MEKIKYVNSITVEPKHDFILVKVDPEDDMERTAGGIIIPKGALQNKKTITGTVVARGKGRYGQDGHLLPMQCEVGDRIICAIYVGYPVMLSDDGEHSEYVLIKDYDAMGVVKEDATFVDADALPTRMKVDSERGIL